MKLTGEIKNFHLSSKHNDKEEKDNDADTNRVQSFVKSIQDRKGKVYNNALEAIGDVKSGSTLLVGGMFAKFLFSQFFTKLNFVM